MLNLAEYARRPASLADYLPWACLVAPGVVLNKDGAFQRTVRYRGPDLDSATEAELIAVTARLNTVLKRFGSGWALFLEAARVEANAYPGARFGDAASWLVDEERKAAFSADGAHYESRYALTFLYLPPPDHAARAERWFYKRAEAADAVVAGGWGELESFITETTRALELLAAILPEAAALDDAETLAYLHGTISSKPQPIAVPAIPAHLDAMLCDTPLLGGVAPKLGERHLAVLTVLGFPAVTTPGLLDALNDLGLAYRWVTRWIALDKHAATASLTRLRRQWFAKRKSIAAVLREVMFNRETALIDPDATSKAEDAHAALEELGADDVAFGHLTTTVVVADESLKRAEEQLLAVERILNGRGFVTIRETLNAVEAWLGSLPGNPYANVRQPIVHSLNLAHMMPVSCVWAGPAVNQHLAAPPLMLTRTRGATPFRLDLHAGDVGHAFVVGPTGSGKSVLLALLALQFRRFIGAQVILFDRGRSLRAAALAMGGTSIALGLDGALALQPLARIDEPAELAIALDWVTGLLASEGVAITPDVKDAVWTALKSLSTAPRRERTLTGLAVLVQSQALVAALSPYTLDGAYGRMLDGDAEDLALTDVVHIELEALLAHGRLVAPVLTHLFHRLEARFCGRPTLLVLDEAWTFLDEPLFAARLRTWLKTLRKKNVAVVFATQSLADIERSSIAPALIESCPTRLLLPNAHALEPQARAIYERFGLNARQVEILATATPKRDYYVQTPAGHRLFELGLGPVALALCGAGAPEDQRLIDRCLDAGTDQSFADRFLRAKGLDWAAELLAAYPGAPAAPPPVSPAMPRPASQDGTPGDAPANTLSEDNSGASELRPELPPWRARPRANRAARRRAARGLPLVLAGLLVLALPTSLPALTVFDPANYQQNLLAATRALEQINTQVRQLETQVQMLRQLDRTLVPQRVTLAPDLARALADLEQRLGEGSGIALELAATEAAYARLFPQELTAALSGDAVLRNARARWREAHASLARAARVEGQIADSVAADTRRLGQALDQSLAAPGALAAAQAGNELAGLSVKQALQLQSLLAAESRAGTLARARDLATEDEARQRFKQFIGAGPAYREKRP